MRLKITKTAMAIIGFDILFLIAIIWFNIDILMSLTLIIWINMLVYSMACLEKRNVLFAFLISFFAFLMGRQLLDVFGLHERTEIFSSEIEIHAELSLLISIVGFVIGYLFNSFFKIESHRKTKSNAITFDVNSIRTASKYYFYLSYIFLISKTIESTLFVMANGYLASYVSFISRIPLPLRVIGESAIPAYFLFLATMPPKNKAVFPVALHVLYLLLNLVGGRRYRCIAVLLILFIYFNMRNRLGEKWFGKRETVISIVGVSGIVIFAYLIGKTRFGDTVDITSIGKVFEEFIYEQGVSINVIKRAYGNVKAFQEGRLYMFGTTIHQLQTSLIGRLLGIRAYGGNTAEYAKYGYSMAHALSYRVMGERYLEGGGTGSSYIAEVFFSFGYIGVFLANIFYGILCKNLMNFKDNNVWRMALDLIIMQQVLFAPRGNFDGFISVILDGTTWGTLILIAFIARIIEVSQKVNTKTDVRKAIE